MLIRSQALKGDSFFGIQEEWSISVTTLTSLSASKYFTALILCPFIKVLHYSNRCQIKTFEQESLSATHLQESDIILKRAHHASESLVMNLDLGW